MSHQEKKELLKNFNSLINFFSLLLGKNHHVKTGTQISFIYKSHKKKIFSINFFSS